MTGHTGFLGGWLTLALKQFGAEIFGYALAPITEPSLYDDGGLGAIIPGVIADIRDRNRLKQVIKDIDPHVIFHLAAQPLVLEAERDPCETIDVNVTGTAALLDAVRHECKSVEAVLVITSDKVYLNQERQRGYREDDELGGHEAYGVSKACAELVVDAFRRSHFPQLMDRPPGFASARAGNIIGGGDWAEYRIVPDAMQAFSNHKPLEVRNLDAVRPWQHVLEFVHGLLTLADNARAQPIHFSGPWNFGPRDTDCVPVQQLVNELVRAWGDDARWEQAGEAPRGRESTLLKVDSSKSIDELGWRPIWSVDRSIRETVDWYKSFYCGEDILAKTRNQIDAFFSETTA